MSSFPEDLSLELPFSGRRDASAKGAYAAIELQVTDLFEQSRTGMLRYLCSMGLSVADGEEVTQEVFILLFQHLRQQKPQGNLRGWLFRVAHNLGLKRRASVQVQRQFAAVENDAVSISQPALEPSPEEQVLFRQRQQRLLAVVDALPAQDRHCLYLRSEGLRYREIAEILDISLGGVAKSLSRALERLASSEERWIDASGV